MYIYSSAWYNIIVIIFDILLIKTMILHHALEYIHPKKSKN